MFFQSSTVVLTALASAVQASSLLPEPIKVTVGENGLLAFKPNNILAPVGTKIEFSFFPKNHTVTQSSFLDPCHPLASAPGFFSGFIPTTLSPSPTTFTIEVKDTNPIWFYCSQTTGSHCQKGMVGAVNAPMTGAKTLEQFVLLARNATTATAPGVPGAGGVLANSSVSASASASASTTATATATATATGYGNLTMTLTGSASASASTTSAGSTLVTTATVAGTTSSSSTGSSSSSTSTSTGTPQIPNGSMRAVAVGMSKGASMMVGLAVVFAGMSFA